MNHWFFMSFMSKKYKRTNKYFLFKKWLRENETAFIFDKNLDKKNQKKSINNDS